MNIFDPLITYSSPLATAVVWMPETSEPAPGSVSPKQPRIGASTSGPSHCFFCSSVPAIRIGPAPRPLAPIDVPMPEQPQLSSSPTSIPSKHGSSGAAEPLRQVQVHEADLVRLGDDVGRMRLMLVTLRRARPDLVLGERAREGAQLLLLVGEGEGDAAGDTRIDCGHSELPWNVD